MDASSSPANSPLKNKEDLPYCWSTRLSKVKPHPLNAFGAGVDARRHATDRQTHPVEVGAKTADCRLGPLFPLPSGNPGMVGVRAAGVAFFHADITFVGHKLKKRSLESLAGPVFSKAKID